MRRYSTLASSNRGEITILAIAETIASVVVYVGIAHYLGVFQHIVVAAILAPLWLLRTRGSVRLGIRYYLRVVRWRYSPNGINAEFTQRRWAFEESLKRWASRSGRGKRFFAKSLIMLSNLSNGPIFFLTILSELVIAWGCRILATIVACVSHPLVHFVAMRKNWKRLVLATDFMTIPEWLPGTEQNRQMQRESFLSATSVLEEATPRRGAKFAAIMLQLILFTIPMVFLIYFLPLILRTAIKGVSILYTPLFLVINSDPINHKVDVGTRLIEMQHDNAAMLKRGYAIFAIGSFALTMLFSGFIAKAHAWFEPEATPVFILLAEYYFPMNLRVWQAASAINGLLFLYLSTLYAPQAALRLERGVLKPSEVRTFLNRWVGVQMALSIYSTMCAIVIFANFFLHHQFPARHWQWFPTVRW